MKQLARYRLIIGFILFGLLVTAVSIITAPWIGVHEVGEVMSLIQIALAVFLLPPAIYAFVQQVVSLQDVPELDIDWNMPNPVLEVPKEASVSWIIQPKVGNSGNAVAVWYFFTFNIPAELLGNNYGRDFTLEPIVGTTREHWRHGLIDDRVNPPYWSITFMSNGEIASYPNNDMFLATLHLNLESEKQYQDTYTIKYVIAADKGRRKDGEFILRVRREAPAKEMTQDIRLDMQPRTPKHDH